MENKKLLVPIVLGAILLCGIVFTLVYKKTSEDPFKEPEIQTLAPKETKPIETEKKTEDKKDKKTKEKVILTDDYIKSLENYLNNQDAKIRLTAAKELLDRFKEDKTRKADPALTALLNKTIQDPKASVRYIGLTILDTNYAQGNEETVNILKQLQNRPDLEYGEDSRLASQILLKMSGQRVEVPDDTPQPEAKQAEEKAA